jgi:hypothetical protein
MYPLAFYDVLYDVAIGMLVIMGCSRWLQNASLLLGAALHL